LAFYALLVATSLCCTLRDRPHIIHAHLDEGTLIGHALSRLWPVPLIFDFRGSLSGEMMDHGFLRPDSSLRRPLLWLLEQIDWLPDAIVVSSEHASELLIRDFACLPSKMDFVPDSAGVDALHAHRPPQESKELK
jgi:hypothetical protein